MSSTLSLAAEPLVLEPGVEMTLSCSTQAVVILPAAASSGGTVQVRLQREEPAADHKGTWSVEEFAPAHGSSFGSRDKVRCAAGCEMSVPEKGRIELWSPKRVAADTLPAGEPLVVIAIDPVTMKLNATTVLGKEIAAFEQGTCERR